MIDVMRHGMRTGIRHDGSFFPGKCIFFVGKELYGNLLFYAGLCLFAGKSAEESRFLNETSLMINA